jgi:hypothetical protein
MSAITCIQAKGNYNFSIEKPTQSQKSIAIQQTSEGLKIFVKDGLKTIQVEKSLIDGLPKMNLVPQEFFDGCHATLKTIDGEAKVVFCGSLRGGMQGGLDDLIDALRTNLENDYEEELSEEDINIVFNTFKQVVEKKQSGADENQLIEFGKNELGKYQNKEELAKAFTFVMSRAEGKYGTFFFSGWGVKINITW